MKKLIVINGAPGSGKTTLVEQLRKQCDYTIIQKDSIKEFFFDYVGIGDREWSRALGKASIDALFALVDQLLFIKDELIIETAFYAPATREDIKKLQAHHEFEVLEIYCEVDEATRRQRFLERAHTNRHPGHADLQSPSEAADNIERYEPLNIGDVMHVTSDETIDIKGIAEAIHRFATKGV